MMCASLAVASTTRPHLDFIHLETGTAQPSDECRLRTGRPHRQYTAAPQRRVGGGQPRQAVKPIVALSDHRLRAIVNIKHDGVVVASGGLYQLGNVSTLGQLAVLPLAAAQAQLGWAGLRAWELARGIDREPLRPQAAPEHPAQPVRRDGASRYPTGELDDLTLTLTNLRGDAGIQSGWWPEHRRGLELARRPDVAAGVDRVVALEPESALPERRRVFAASLRPLSLPQPVQVTTLGSGVPRRMGGQAGETGAGPVGGGDGMVASPAHAPTLLFAGTGGADGNGL